MRRASRLGVTGCLVAVVALSCASAGLGTAAQEQCFGLQATMVGTEGPDQLVGTQRSDVIVGLGGDDIIWGFEGNDALCGGAGNDAFVPGPGNDRMDGGGGGFGVGFIELVAFEFSPSPVQANLRTDTAIGEGSDTLVNITGLLGTRFADTLVGDSGVNQFFPRSGNDSIDGGEGDDVTGFDGAIQANLATGTAIGEGTDKLVSIEGLIGSDFSDALTGDNGRNYLAGDDGDDTVDGGGGSDRVFGDAGNDYLAGGGGGDRLGGGDGNDTLLGLAGDDTLEGDQGDDTLDGGDGVDTVSYARSTSPIQANLGLGQVTGQGLDTLSGVEDLESSPFRDSLLGDARTNFLIANGGGVIDAKGGADFLDGGAAPSSLLGGPGRDYCLRGGGSRRCEISGVPGRVPRIPDKPPAWRALVQESAVSSRAGIVMPLPGGQRAARGRIRAVRERVLDVFVNGESPRPVAGGVWSVLPPLSRLLASATPPGTGSFRYQGQPMCFATRKPYRTTAAPPNRVQPAVPDGGREQVFWRGVLFRQRQRPRKLVRARATPWVTAVVQGPGVPTGFPLWTNTDGTSLGISSFSFKVQAGTYAWVGTIRWVRTGAGVDDFMEPHIVRIRGGQRPDKSCTFGRKR